MATATSVLSKQQLLAIINTQTAIVRLGFDWGEVITRVAESSMGLLKADGAAIELAEGEDMVYRAAAGIALNRMGLRVSKAHSLSGLCVRTCACQASPDVEVDPRVDLMACRKIGLRSMLIEPLVFDGRCVGVLKVMWKQARSFGEDCEEQMRLLSAFVGAAMHHAEQYESGDLFYRATHDPLTGLGNRALFNDRLRKAVEHGKRAGCAVGILMVDMDGLKQLNDRLGHRAGDFVLKELAARLAHASRECDTVTRIGGDEFGVVLSAVRGRSDVQLTAQRYTKRLQGPCHVGKEVTELRASVGFACFPDDGNDIVDLQDIADRSMYEQKRANKLHACLANSTGVSATGR